MKKRILKGIKKGKIFKIKRGKVFTKKEVNTTLYRDCTHFKVNSELIYKRRDRLYNIEEIELKETIFIEEENYQQIKKKMCKEEDYFTKKELKKISVISI